MRQISLTDYFCKGLKLRSLYNFGVSNKMEAISENILPK